MLDDPPPTPTVREIVSTNLQSDASMRQKAMFSTEEVMHFEVLLVVTVPMSKVREVFLQDVFANQQLPQ